MTDKVSMVFFGNFKLRAIHIWEHFDILYKLKMERYSLLLLHFKEAQHKENMGRHNTAAKYWVYSSSWSVERNEEMSLGHMNMMGHFHWDACGSAFHPF